MPGILKVQDPPGSGNWVPVVSPITIYPEPDWGGYTNDVAAPASLGTVTGTAAKAAFVAAQFHGVGVKSDGANGLLIAKNGIYRLQADMTVQSSNAGWVIAEIRVYRAGALLKTFSIVSGNNSTGGFIEMTVHALTDLLAGDIAYVYMTTSATGTNTIDGRSQFTCHQIATSSASSGDLTAGFRANAVQSIPNAVVTTVALQVADHTCGGITIDASNIVTVATAGVYQLSATLMFEATGATSRRLLMMETWTGTDPGVGAATQLAREDLYLTGGQYAGFSIADQQFLAAGAKLRLLAYQASGAAMNTNMAPSPRLNIRKASQGGLPNDTGWLRPGDPGGPVWGAGWTDNNPAAELVVAKRIGTVVKTRGLAWRTSGSSLVMFTLPLGWRPSRAIYRPGLLSGTWAYVNVATNGDVSVPASGAAVTNSTNAVGFDIEFDLAQP